MFVEEVLNSSSGLSVCAVSPKKDLVDAVQDPVCGAALFGGGGGANHVL